MRGRYLKPNKSTTSPRSVVFLDTESIPDPNLSSDIRQYHKFRLGCAIGGRIRKGKLTGRRILCFTDPFKFWAWLSTFCSPKHTTWLIAHNVMFDLILCRFADMMTCRIFDLDKPGSSRRQIIRNGKSESYLKMAVLEDPPTILGIREIATGKRFVCVDSLNWFRCTLARLGDSVELAKMQMPAFGAPNNDWFNYCLNDCAILERAFLRYVDFVRENDLGVFKWTAAGQAMQAFRHRFMKDKILFHDNLTLKRAERLAYFGGRSECWRLGLIKESSWHLDINSMYPSVMLGGQYPVNVRQHKLGRTWRLSYPACDPTRTLCRVRLQTDEPLYPYRDGMRVTYPVGRFETLLCGPEFAQALERGHVRQTADFIEYDTAAIFDDYVEFFWELRKRYAEKSDITYEELSKLFLNTLHGKFGQKSAPWKSCDVDHVGYPWSKWRQRHPKTRVYTWFRSLGYDVQYQDEANEQVNSFPAISAWTSSYARVRMNELREIAGAGNVHYQAVDSLIVTDEGFCNLKLAGQVDKKELGKLKVLHTARDCFIRGINDYEIQGERIKAGVKPSAVYNPDGTITQAIFRSASHIFSVASNNQILVESVTIKPGDAYEKGKVKKNGQVEPFELSQF